MSSVSPRCPRVTVIHSVNTVGICLAKMSQSNSHEPSQHSGNMSVGGTTPNHMIARSEFEVNVQGVKVTKPVISAYM